MKRAQPLKKAEKRIIFLNKKIMELEHRIRCDSQEEATLKEIFRLKEEIDRGKNFQLHSLQKRICILIAVLEKNNVEIPE